MKTKAHRNILSQQSKKEMLRTTLIYLLAHFGLLLNYKGIWWDDWTLRGTPLSELVKEYSDLGSFPEGLANLHYLLNILGPASYRIITFVTYLVSALLLYRLINRDLPEKNLAFLCAIMFSILPLNEARIAAIDVAYALSLCSFMMASYLIRTRTILSCCLLFVSYMTASLLPFTLMILTNEIISLSKNGFKGRKLFLNSRIIFLTLTPLLYWTIKNLWYQPVGKYEAYNTNFSVSNSPYIIKETILGITTFQIEPLVLILCLPVVYVIAKDVKHSRIPSLILMMTGAAIFLIGCIPYWLVGLIPSHTDWNSRHQLLMPFGLSLLLIGIIEKVPRIRVFLITAIVSISISSWTNLYLGFLNETTRNQEIISSLSANVNQIEGCEEFLFFDNRIQPKGLKLRKRFYEWNGMLIESGFKGSFTAIPENNEESFDTGNYDQHLTPAYKVSKFTRSTTNTRCRVDFGTGENFMKVSTLN